MSKTGEHSEEYLTPYRDMVRRVGPRFEALLWNSRQTQEARFAAMDEMIDLTGRVVVDAGCGTGDLLVWLNDAQVRYGHYLGLDALAELVEVARRLALPESSFEVSDFVADAKAFARLRPRPDVIVFSGSLNTLEQDRAEGVLGRAWRACDEAVCFNFLSDRNGQSRAGEIGPARRFDTLHLIEWALDRTPLVSFRQDYLGGNDATILMRKPRGR